MPSSLTARSRNSSFANNPTAPPGPSGHAPTTFFLASEQQVEDSMARQLTRRQENDLDGSQAGRSKADRQSQGGLVADKVQTIEEALTAAFGPGGDTIRAKPLSRSTSDRSKSGDAVSESGKKRKRKGHTEELETIEGSSSSGLETPRHGDTSAHSSPQPLHNIPLGHVRRLSGGTMSNPLTPINVDSPAYDLDSGIPSTPKSVSLRSLRLSDDDEHDDLLLNDNSSQAVASTDDEDEGEPEHHHSDSVAPELVMPSIAMPSRRPFTENGKRLGRLKIMVVGRNNTGKTGLIRSIVQLCEDIVHVDPVPVPISSIPCEISPLDKRRMDAGASPWSSSSGKQIPALRCATEIFASTRAYPSWWSDIDESKAVRRRKSMGLGDTILERNVSFIDTPGFESDEYVDANVVSYIESLMRRSTSPEMMSDSEMLHMLSGGGGAQVDVILFLFPCYDEQSLNDILFCQRLTALTNVIPLFGKADLLDESTVRQRKQELAKELSIHAPKIFKPSRPASSPLTTSIQQDQNAVAPSDEDQMANATGATASHSTLPHDPPEASPSRLTPFAISSAPGPDHETMDASLLMSSDYCPPPVPSELQDLVQLLFDPENAARLRHTSARKLLAWRHAEAIREVEATHRPGSPGSPWKVGLGIPSSASLARMAALTGRRSPVSEKAPVPKWAADLRKALRHDRIREGLIEPTSSAEKKKATKPRRPKRHWSEISTISTSQTTTPNRSESDVFERVAGVTWIALRFVSLIGVMGVTACVVARRCFGVESVTIGWGGN